MVRSCFGGDPTRLPEPALATINWMAGMEPSRLTNATIMSDIGTEWTPSRLLPKSSALSASWRCRILDH